jgi:acylphosphatase
MRPPLADLQAIRARFRGVVQGVGFRAHVQDYCRAARISGWVRNLPDGSVEAELIGAVDELRDVVRRIQADRPHQVSSVDVMEIPVPATVSPRFEILH